MFELACYIDEERARKGNMLPHVSLRCSCNRTSLAVFSPDKFSTITKDCAILKDGESVTCPYCGAVQTSDDGEIRLENQRSGVKPTIICCPKCKSSNLKKVSIFQQVALYALYSPKFLSQYECQKCFYKW